MDFSCFACWSEIELSKVGEKRYKINPFPWQLRVFIRLLAQSILCKHYVYVYRYGYYFREFPSVCHGYCENFCIMAGWGINQNSITPERSRPYQRQPMLWFIRKNCMKRARKESNERERESERKRQEERCRE